MEEYIRDRAKHKAIAVYTFNTINCDGSTSIKRHKLRQCLTQTLHHFNKNIELEQVEKIINSVDKLHKNVFELEEFCEVFQKTFNLLAQYDSSA